MSTRQKTPLDLSQIARFASVGVINSVLGYAVILAALFVGAGDFVSNALGYATGLCVSFILNSQWAFSPKKGYKKLHWAPYLVLFCLAFSANLLVVAAARHMGFVENPITHLFAMATYTGIFYLGLTTLTSRKAAQTDAKSQLSADLEKNWPEFVVALGCIVTLGLIINIPLSHDVVWQTWIARQVLGGAELYYDILEINPPLWFWMAIPSEALTNLVSLTSKQSIILFVWIYAASALCLFAILIRAQSPSRRMALLTMAATSMLLVTLPYFGQREHYVMIAAIPYTALIAQRIQGQPINWVLALGIAGIAAAGFALKHYFVLIPVVLEFWLLLSLRSKWRPLRTETLMLLACALIYAGAVYLFAPGFFENIIPMVLLAYHGYEVPLWVTFVRPHIFLWCAGSIIFLVLPGRKRPMARGFMLAAFALMIAYFMQQKAWGYHSVAATGLILLGLIAALNPPRGPLLEKLKFAFVALLLVFGLQITLFSGPYKNANLPAITQLLDDTPPQSIVMMLSAHPSTIWPMVDDMGFVWPSRHFAFWMLSTFAQETQKQGALSNDMQALAHQVRVQTAHDLGCNPPDIILVDDHSKSLARGLDPIAYFSKNAQFAALFSHYKLGEKRSRFTSYIKDSAWQPADIAACRNIF